MFGETGGLQKGGGEHYQSSATIVISQIGIAATTQQPREFVVVANSSSGAKIVATSRVHDSGAVGDEPLDELRMPSSTRLFESRLVPAVLGIYVDSLLRTQQLDDR
jgi:hypothetical protein